MVKLDKWSSLTSGTLDWAGPWGGETADEEGEGREGGEGQGHVEVDEAVGKVEPPGLRA